MDETPESTEHGLGIPGLAAEDGGESGGWPAGLAVMSAAALQLSLPGRLAMPPRYLPARPGDAPAGGPSPSADPGRIDRRDKTASGSPSHRPHRGR